MILRARFVLPVTAPAIENGAVAVEGERIADVGPATNCSTTDPATDFGDAVILPGLVNAHTHLELSAHAGRIPPGPDVIDWLERLVETLRADPPTEERVPEAVRRGVEQSLRSGVTALGDITRFPAWSRPVLDRCPLRGVSFGEIIAVGTKRGTARAQIDEAAAFCFSSPRWRVGLSPHAPYTVEPDVLETCAAFASAAHHPLSMHLAELPEEETFTRTRSGPLAEYLQRLGVWDEQVPIPGCRPVEMVAFAGLLTPRTVLAHVNYVGDEDIALIARSGASVAYCPRTHAAFGHPPHRFRDMLRAGVNVCLGTDSLASNPSLSVLDEVRFLHRRHPDVPPEDLLRMATLHGARALGLAREVGSLERGKAADLVVVPCPAGTTDPWAPLLGSDAPPLAVFIAGAGVHGPGCAE